MTSWIVVGTKDCPTQKIASLMKQSKDYHHFHEKWQGFAADLSVDQLDIKKLTRQVDLGTVQLTNIVREIVEIWVGKTGSGATLDQLVDALRLNDLGSIAELLKDEFQLKSSRWDVPSYYISRTLITRNVLDETFPEELLTSDDIFVFAGVSHSKLNNLLKNQISENSTRIVQQAIINHNYIILDYPTHFSKICEKAKRPVHLIKLDEKEDKWIHVKSSGNLSVMRDVIDKSDTRLNENELIDYLKSEVHPVCISDSPGMGKSTLLQHIGQQLIKADDRKVLYAAMNEIVAVFMKNDAKDEVERRTLLELTLNKLFCNNAAQTSSLALKLNSKDLEIELLLDGLDEVTSSNMSVAFELLKYFSKIPSIRVWVTTRPHLLEDVENSLNVFAYSIQGFTKENQISFLRDFWLFRNKNLATERLEQFAEICLAELNAKVSRKDGDIAGIPLQCLLLGEVYKEQAEEHSVATNPNETWIIHINSLVELYQRLIEKQYSKYKLTSGQNLLTEEEIRKHHIILAVQLSFPELIEKLPDLFNQKVNLNELLKVGLLEKSSTVLVPKFVHRTIGEFYIANFLVQLLNLSSDKDILEFLNHCLNKVFECKEIDILFHIDILYFMQDFVVNCFVNNEICHFFDTLITECDKVICLDTHIIFNHLYQACIYGDYLNIFKTIRFKPTEESSLKDFDDNLLYLAIEYAGIEFLKIIFENNPTLLDNQDIKTTSLCLSIRRGKLAQLRYLLNVSNVRELLTHPNDETNLVLHVCLEDSTAESSSTVKEKIEILEILLDINPDLLEQQDHLNRTPILCGDTHPELLEKLIKRNANVLAKDIKHNTVLHAHYSSLGVMFEKLSTEKLRFLIKFKNVDGETPLMNLIRNYEPSLQILKKFKKFGADFNCKDNKGYSVLAHSVLKFRTTETITSLIDLGANVHWKKGWKRKSLLHIAAECGNVDAMHLLESQFKMKIDEKDWSFKSPDDYLKKLYQKHSYGLSNQQINSFIYKTKGHDQRLSSGNKTEMLKASVYWMNDFAVKHFLKDGADFVKNNNSEWGIVETLIYNFELEQGIQILNTLINSRIIEVHNNSLIVFTDKGKRFLLHWAVKNADEIELVVRLVDEYKQNVNATDDDGKTPLQYLINRI